MQIITAAVIKGGTGKTTACATLAQAAAFNGKRVLAIDLDPQANLTNALGANQNTIGSYELLNGTPAEEVIQETAQHIDVIPASPNLAAIKTSPGSAKRLQNALQPILGNYDFIFIDTPPTLSDLQFNALQAATGLIIPLEADQYSLQGLYQITDIAGQMQRSNPNLKVLGAFMYRYNGRGKIYNFFRDAIKKTGEEVGAPLVAEIRPGVSIAEAAALRKSLFEHAPKSNPAQDYMQLYKNILED